MKAGHSVRVYSNQKEIDYISASNITATVETRPPQLRNFTLFLSLPPIPNILRASSPVLREVLRYKYF